jgi:hypothetical protein
VQSGIADGKSAPPMVDHFAIALTHGLIALALWRMLYRDDLDHEVSPRQQWQRKRDNADHA